MACAAARATLDGLQDDELRREARSRGEGFRDVAGLYAAQVDHLAKHDDDVRRVVRRGAGAAGAAR